MYDKPFRSERATNIYRPGKRAEEEFSEEDLAKLRSTDRFRADKGFSGADGRVERAGPVQFEKAAPAADVFGLEDFVSRGRKREGCGCLYRPFRCSTFVLIRLLSFPRAQGGRPRRREARPLLMLRGRIFY